MAKCEDCSLDMSTTSTCFIREITIGDKEYQRNTEYFDVNERCHDCGIENKKGNIHHYGCDMERCPKCEGQIISCDC